ncbi:hypothetical protein K439DRAFT_1640086 [Ramaria rubella]|nr:hypothetical protein K439DRAFT_1640086 [Ramaria rubella]
MRPSHSPDLRRRRSSGLSAPSGNGMKKEMRSGGKEQVDRKKDREKTEKDTPMNPSTWIAMSRLPAPHPKCPRTSNASMSALAWLFRRIPYSCLVRPRPAISPFSPAINASHASPHVLLLISGIGTFAHTAATTTHPGCEPNTHV